jgi:hypothetical protein
METIKQYREYIFNIPIHFWVSGLQIVILLVDCFMLALFAYIRASNNIYVVLIVNILVSVVWIVLLVLFLMHYDYLTFLQFGKFVVFFMLMYSINVIITVIFVILEILKVDFFSLFSSLTMWQNILVIVIFFLSIFVIILFFYVYLHLNDINNKDNYYGQNPHYTGSLQDGISITENVVHHNGAESNNSGLKKIEFEELDDDTYM